MITAQQLLTLEERYGGFVTDTMHVKSPLDPRENKHAGESPIVGGDRMRNEDYRNTYAKHLPSSPDVVIELGIFKGTGLAIWCDVYPNADVTGLDIDPTHFDFEGLKNKGAFQFNLPEVLFFDKYENNSIFYHKKQPIDLMIDDSAHDTDGIVFAFENVLPFLSNDFVYIIEDNAQVESVLRDKFPELSIIREGGPIVIKRRTE